MPWSLCLVCILVCRQVALAVCADLRRSIEPHLSSVLERRVSLLLNNSEDLSYHVDISLGGQMFKVLIDTGSSDLWVAGNVSRSNDTRLRGRVQYAVGKVEGPIKTASLVIAGHSVLDQAFLEIAPDAQHAMGMGILGLGPDSGSFIHRALPSTAGAPMLNRIFLQNRTTPNFFTILLGRDKDPTDAFSGSITVGEVLDEYKVILDEPKMTMTHVPEQRTDDQHLQILLDADGIIGPDGLSIPFTSSVQHSKNSSRATVVLDSGFTLPQLPRSVADAIYGRFYGAEYVTVQGIGSTWVLPCDQEVNVTFKFEGKLFPMHPLDMTISPSVLGLAKIMNMRQEECCIASFQPFTYDRGASPNYDMVFGMAFMRNAYTLFDYGDFIVGLNTTKPPYVQMLPTTNATEAHSDFVTVRLGGIEIANKGLVGGTPPAKSGNSVLHAIVISVSVVGALVVLVGFFTYRSRRRRRTG